MADPEASSTLTYPIALLAEPAFGAQVVALLQGHEQLGVETSAGGFIAVRTAAGARDFVPEALCRLGTPPGQAIPAMRTVTQNTTLYRRPMPGEQYGARWLVPPNEPLRVLENAGMFRKIQRPNGQIGYVPTTLCRTSRATPRATECHLVQTVALYSSPTPGGQFESRWQISPSEQLLELGRDGQFVLVQRESGELGYLPSAVCGEMIPDSILPLGPVDLGWIVVGGGWALVNWGGVALALYELSVVDAVLKPYIGLAVVLGVGAAVWFGQRRSLMARSFAIGVLLAYALLHFSSGGLFTLWR